MPLIFSKFMQLSEHPPLTPPIKGGEQGGIDLVIFQVAHKTECSSGKMMLRDFVAERDEKIYNNYSIEYALRLWINHSDTNLC